MDLIILVIIIAVIVALIFYIGKLRNKRAIKKAGNQGEKIIKNAIRSVLHKGDTLHTNVKISYDGKKTELDSVVVNHNGVFIVEVKNYSGTLVGNAEDSEWAKYHVSKGQNVYEKTVRNPIPQVKRQIHILSGYLKSKGIKVWIDGYAVFVNNNSPVHNSYVLEGLDAMDRAFHKTPKRYLTDAEVQAIRKALS